MSDSDLVILFTLILSATTGAIGGLLAVLLLKLRDRNMHTLTLDPVAPLNVQVELHAQPVQLAIATRQPAPVVVEMITAAPPTLRERAAVIMAVFPRIGATDLHHILGCSKSSAWAIIQDVHGGRIALPELPESDDEGLPWPPST